MKSNGEQLDLIIKERITSELQQLSIPSIDEEWLKFKSLAATEPKNRRLTMKSWAAGIAVLILIISSLILFKPVQAYAFGEHCLQILSHIVGKTTHVKTATINSSSSGETTPQVQELGSLVEKEVPLEEAQQNVHFTISKPKYLPPGTTSMRITLTNLSADVNRVTMNYDVQGQLLIFAQQNTVSSVSQGLLYDTDDTINKDITINGTPATLLQQKDGLNVLTWYQHGLLLDLRGKLPTEEFIKIAESIS